MSAAPHRSAWDVDLAHGEAGEALVKRLLSGKGVEVKRDRLAWRTGRVFIEHSYRGRPSGLAVTQADWWAIILDDEAGRFRSVVFVPVWRLRELCFNAPFAKGGDGLASHGVLVHLTALL